MSDIKIHLINKLLMKFIVTGENYFEIQLNFWFWTVVRISSVRQSGRLTWFILTGFCHQNRYSTYKSRCHTMTFKNSLRHQVRVTSYWEAGQRLLRTCEIPYINLAIIISYTIHWHFIAHIRPLLMKFGKSVMIGE